MAADIFFCFLKTPEGVFFVIPRRHVTKIHGVLIEEINHREKKRLSRKENDMKKIKFA